MKKLISLFTVFLFSMFLLSGCSGQEVSEAKLKADENGMVRIGDQWLEQPGDQDDKSAQRFSEKILNICSTYLTEENSAYLAIIPDKSWYARDQVEVYIDHERMMSNLSSLEDALEIIDIASLLQLSDFYLTDAHWRQECLTPIVDALGQSMGFEITCDFKQQDFSPYFGMYCDSISSPPEDTLSYLTSQFTNAATVDNYQQPQVFDVYETAKLQSDVPYDVFLQGPTPLITISGHGGTEGRSLVVFRDSFGSSLVPLLLEAYETVTMVDLRYMPSQMVGDYVSFGSSDVLFLYSAAVVNTSAMLK